ncbi:hypothetical protein U1Q18_036349 [Sarracenia purpurea var. burkii]
MFCCKLEELISYSGRMARLLIGSPSDYVQFVFLGYLGYLPITFVCLLQLASVGCLSRVAMEQCFHWFSVVVLGPSLRSNWVSNSCSSAFGFPISAWKVLCCCCLVQ